MRKISLRVGVILTLAASIGLSSCIGSFGLTNRLLSWNNSIGNKFVNELVFFAFLIVPVYEVSALADVLVINSIEFWSGENPMACGTKRIQGNDGRDYLVKCDGKGYDIVCENDGSSVRLDFTADDQTWRVALPDGEAYPLITFNGDGNTVTMPTADGLGMTVDLTPAGVLAYRAAARTIDFASIR